MKTPLLLLIFGLSVSVCQAKYEPLPLARLLDDSHLIGQGQIVQVKPDYILVQFSEFLKGNHKDKLLKIKRFEDWVCAERWTPYQVGQQELLFVRITQNKELQLMGAGNEGEMPLEAQKLYYKSLEAYMDPRAKTYRLKGGKLNGYCFDLAEVKAGIRAYLSDRKQFHDRGRQKTFSYKTLKSAFLQELVFELRTRVYRTEKAPRLLTPPIGGLTIMLPMLGVLGTTDKNT